MNYYRILLFLERYQIRIPQVDVYMARTKLNPRLKSLLSNGTHCHSESTSQALPQTLQTKRLRQ